MSSFDRITGNYTLQTLAGSCGQGDIRIVANDGDGNIYLNGNLYVIGTLANVKSETTYVTDNYIRLTSEVEGTPVMNAGLIVDRGNECHVEIRWNETRDRWEYTENCTTYYPLLGKVQQDLTPVLGGDLNLNCRQIQTDYPCNIVLNPGIQNGVTRGAVEIKEVSPLENVGYNSGSSTIYAKPPDDCGDIGLRVRTASKEEKLVSRRYAAVLSLVL